MDKNNRGRSSGRSAEYDSRSARRSYAADGRGRAPSCGAGRQAPYGYSGRDVYSSSRYPGRTAAPSGRDRGSSYDPDELDRYNYVDRDVYSGAAPRRRTVKKKGGAKRFFKTLLVLVLVLALGGFLYFNVLASRLNRPGNADSAALAGYVQQPSGAPSWNVASDGSVKNILLIGADENEDGTDGRSDSNMLVSVDGSTKQVRLVSFLRDTYLQIPTLGKNKLNAAYSKGGPALTMQTLENNYRVNIDKYVSVDFDSFATLIDKMGGLDVPMSEAACEAENENMGSHLKAGTNHLNGKLCLYYVRIRHATDDFGHDDYGRAARQRQVMQLIIQKMKSNPILATKAMYDFLPYVKTNLDNSELAYLVSFLAVSGGKTQSLQIPANNAFTTKSVKGIGDVLVPDLEKNSALLRQFLYGSSADSTAEN